MPSIEFSPNEYFKRVMNLWWLVFLAIVLGGVFGFVFYQLRPPIYEATATFFATVDLNRFPLKEGRADLIQYNEDMALGTTEGALQSSDVRDVLISQLKSLGIALSPSELLKNSTIERKHDIWELRFRSKNPEQAQIVVNAWADIGYQAMLSWQASGKAPDYVIFQPPTLALIPQEPVLYGRNKVMLAGALIGFIIGILLSSYLGRRVIENIQNPHA